MNRAKRFAVLAVVAVPSVLTPAHAADLLVSSALVAHPLEGRPAIGCDERP
jgi:hypothetical protein